MATKKQTTNTSGLHLHRSDPKSKLGQYFYWNAFAKNGREIARSSEVYSSKQAAIKGLQATAVLFRSIGFTYTDNTGKEPVKKTI